MIYDGKTGKSPVIGKAFPSFQKAAVQGLTVEVDVSGIQDHIVAGHVPDALIGTALLPPGVLDQVIRLPCLVHGLAIDEHDVVVGELPVVPLLLPELLCGPQPPCRKPARSPPEGLP